MKHKLTIFSCLLFFACFDFVNANECNDVPEMIRATATAYCINGVTSTGVNTRIGICAGNPDWYGCVLSIYERNSDGTLGKFICDVECQDTGGKSIRDGKVVDIWFPTKEQCKEFGEKDIYIQVTRGAG